MSWVADMFGVALRPIAMAPRHW